MKQEKMDVLLKLVRVRTGAIIDTGVMHPFANQRYVMSHLQFKKDTASHVLAEAKLQEYLHRMALLWDDTSGKRLHYREFCPPRSAPTQLVAFEQLRFRYESSHDPLLVAIVARAGYGKSELIAAWLFWLFLQGANWETTAPTGIAGSQIAGSTLNAFLLADRDLNSKLFDDEEKQEHFRRVEGIIIDEAFIFNLNVV